MKPESLKQLESLLLSGPIDMDHITAAMGCSHSTIRRAIKELRLLGSDVEYNGSGWFAMKSVFARKAE